MRVKPLGRMKVAARRRCTDRPAWRYHRPRPRVVHSKGAYLPLYRPAPAVSYYETSMRPPMAVPSPPILVGHILPTSEIRSKNRLQLTDVNVIGGSIQHPCCLWLNRGNSLW